MEPVFSAFIGWTVGKSCDWVFEKVQDRITNKKAKAIFQEAFNGDSTQLILWLCFDQEFRDELFKLAEKQTPDGKGLYDRACDFAAEEKDWPKGRGEAQILEALFKLSLEMKNLSEKKISALTGKQIEAFRSFHQTMDRLRSQNIKPRETTTKTTPDIRPIFHISHSPNDQLRHYKHWIKAIRKALSEKGKAAVSQAVVGQGGLGKTAMAVEYAYQYQDEYPGGVYWLESEQGLSQALFNLFEAWGVKLPEGAGEEDLLKLVVRQLNDWPLKLVILDNLEEPGLPARLGLRQAHLLVTTRLSTVSLPKINMELPEEDKAEDIFLAYAGLAKEDLTEAEKEALDLIVERTGRLPLALEIMGGLVAGRGLIGAKNKAGELLKIKAAVQAKGGRDFSVADVLGLAKAEFKHPLAQKALIAAGYLAPEQIDSDLITLAVYQPKNKEEFEAKKKEVVEALAELAELSLLKPNKEGGYTCHRLVQEAARGLDKGQKIGAQLVNVLADLAKQITKSGQYLTGQPLLPHMVHIAAMADKAIALEAFPAEAALYWFARLHELCGRMSEAEMLYSHTLVRFGQAKGHNDSGYATRLNNLAEVLRAQGKYEQAEKLYRQALEIGEKTIGQDHPDYATRLNNLAVVLYAQGKYEQAERLYRQAMEIVGKTWGQEHPHYASSLNNLALVLADQGQLEEAEKLYRQALEIDKGALGEDHPGYATDLNNLADLLAKQGRFKEALPMQEKALEIRLARLGPEHPDTKDAIASLAAMKNAAGEK